jgi:hypothetical protein
MYSVAYLLSASDNVAIPLLDIKPLGPAAVPTTNQPCFNSGLLFLKANCFRFHSRTPSTTMRVPTSLAFAAAVNVVLLATPAASLCTGGFSA